MSHTAKTWRVVSSLVLVPTGAFVPQEAWEGGDPSSVPPTLGQGVTLTDSGGNSLGVRGEHACPVGNGEQEERVPGRDQRPSRPRGAAAQPQPHGPGSSRRQLPGACVPTWWGRSDRWGRLLWPKPGREEMAVGTGLWATRTAVRTQAGCLEDPFRLHVCGPSGRPSGSGWSQAAPCSPQGGAPGSLIGRGGGDQQGPNSPTFPRAGHQGSAQRAAGHPGPLAGALGGPRLEGWGVKPMFRPLRVTPSESPFVLWVPCSRLGVAPRDREPQSSSPKRGHGQHVAHKDSAHLRSEPPATAAPTPWPSRVQAQADGAAVLPGHPLPRGQQLSPTPGDVRAVREGGGSPCIPPSLPPCSLPGTTLL